MKYIGITILFCVLFVGAGCGKSANKDFVPDINADCETAEYPFACYLDKATGKKDPNLCNNAGSKRITCISAYEELLETEVSCDTIQDQSFQTECQQYKQNQLRQNSVFDTNNATDTGLYVDPDYINN
ncbi:MAG: hypothetical protein P1P90_03195 [Patescibacteria group bacterium]|nr:hypothetical protein [Patescibacteria group bacterium]